MKRSYRKKERNVCVSDAMANGMLGTNAKRGSSAACYLRKRTKQAQDEIESQGEETGQENEIHPKISLNSVVGITSPKNFKLKGEVNGVLVVVMIDPGTTHNFIAVNVLHELGVQCANTKNFGVSLGTGERVQQSRAKESVVLSFRTYKAWPL